MTRNQSISVVTKLRLKPPSNTEPRLSERIFVTRRPFGPQPRQLLKPKTCLNRTNIGFRRCLGAMLVFGMAGRASAQSMTDARIRELIKEATSQAGRAPIAADVRQPAAGESRPVVQLTLDDAVKFALERNLDIAVQRLNPQINDIAYASIRSIYHPSLTSTLAAQSTVTPSTTTISGTTQAGLPVEASLDTYNGGLAQSIPWGGGSLSVQLNNSRSTTTNLTSFYNPRFDTNWSGSYVQPLLRNFRIDSTRQQLQVTQLNRDISDVQLRSTITNTLSNVRNAYWDYVFAVEAVEVAQQSLDLASKLVQDNQTRVEVGTMAPIDVVQAQSEQATRRQALVTAQSTKRTAELALKRLIVSGTSDPNWNAELDPIDRPDFQPVNVDLQGAVRRALSQRTDLEIAKKNMASNDVTLRFLRDQMKPQADLVATYGYVGLGGRKLLTEGSGVNRTITGSEPGGYVDALQSLFRTNFPRWTVTMNFSYPLGLSQQEASVARARVQLNQVQAQIKQVELQVATDVTNAAIQAQNTAEAVEAAQAASQLAQKKLEAEQSKFEVGMSTNYFVVQAQRDLADARNSELRAILNYRKSLVELERLQETTLQNLNITVLNAGGATGTTPARTTGTGGTGGQGGGGGQ
jgi:outer membrane protein